MKKFTTILVFSVFLLSNNLYSEDYSISFDLNQYEKIENKQNIFGGFTEFLLDYINGLNGIWAQEFYQRGFDTKFSDEFGFSFLWHPYDLTESAEYELLDGGYNENGNYFQRITKSENGISAISQEIYNNDSVGFDFYIYHKGEIEESEVFLYIISEGNEVLEKYSLGSTDLEWKKTEINIDKINGHKKIRIAIGFEGIGFLDLDEVSIMPSNNVNGIRKEYYEIFKRWKPGNLRYPGGWFADTEAAFWKNAIGHIDQRVSPNRKGSDEFQRMDWGIIEYLEFCKDLEIEPYIVFNYLNGTVDDALNWMEYMTGDQTTEYGSLRISHGILEPYKITYVEVGNEQWYNPDEMSKDFIEYYLPLKEKYPHLRIMVNGNHWGGKEFFDTVFDNTGTNVDIYGFHPIAGYYNEHGNSDEVIFKCLMGYPTAIERDLLRHDEWMIERQLPKSIKLGLTEWWTMYGSSSDWLLDTNIRNRSLESGLINAGVYHLMMRHHQINEIGSRTIGIGLINRGIDSDGNRQIYGGGPLESTILLSNLSGNRYHNSEIETPKFNTPVAEGLWYIWDVPELDVCVTSNEDNIYISVINQTIDKSATATISFNKMQLGGEITVHQMYSDHYMDATTPDEPHKLAPKTWDDTFTGEFTFPKHSLTVLEMPIENVVSVEPNAVKNSEISIYPNPSEDIININFTNSSDSIYNEVQIIDLAGNVVFEKSILRWHSTEKIYHNLPSGAYTLIIKSETERRSLPMIVVR